MKINWLCGKQEWAFKMLCSRYAKFMKSYEHRFDNTEESDVLFIVTAPDLPKISHKEKVVLHLDSYRSLRI